MLGVCLARGSFPGLVVALAVSVLRDLRRRVLIAVRGVFDQFLLGQLEALRLSAASLVDGLALFAVALGGVEQRIWQFRGHATHCIRSSSRKPSSRHSNHDRQKSPPR